MDKNNRYAFEGGDKEEEPFNANLPKAKAPKLKRNTREKKTMLEIN